MGNHGLRVVDPDTQEELWVPEGFEPESAIRRARRAREGRLITLRIQPEHGVTWPIWQRGVGLLSEESLPLSSSVNRALREWSLLWEAHAGVDDAWKSHELYGGWARQAREIEDALEKELWGIAVIERSFREDRG